MDMFRFGITTTAIIRFLSGSRDEQWERLVGSFILIVLVATGGLALIIWACHFAFPQPIDHAGYDLFFLWYPIFMFINIPSNTAQVILQAELKFDRILLINSMYSIGFFIDGAGKFSFHQDELNRYGIGTDGELISSLR